MIEQIRSVPTPPPDLPERRNMLRDYLETNSRDENLDPASRKFDKDLLVAMDVTPAIGEVTDYLLSAQNKPDLQYIGEFLPRALVALELEYDPQHLYETGDVSPAFQRVQEQQEALAKLVFNIGRPIQSNIGNRGWVLAWELQANGLTDDRPVLEFGCSGNAIGHKLSEVIAGHASYQEVDIMERRRRGVANRLVQNPYLTRKFNELVKLPFPAPPRYYGFDLFKPTDPAVQAWIRACSQYLTDWTDPLKREEFDHLQHLYTPNVHWMFEDFSKFTLSRYRQAFPAEDRPRAIYISFSLYELASPQERRRTLKQAADIVTHEDDLGDPRRPGGIVIVLDDIQSIDQHSNVEIVKRRRDYSTTGVWVYNSKLPDAGYQKHFSLKSGRIEAAIPEPALAMLALQAAQQRSKQPLT